MPSGRELARRARVKAVRALRPRAGLRESDVILAAFPKTGSTWVRFILANLLSLLEFDGERIDYHELNGRFAASYDSHLLPSVEYRSLPRFVKTHRTFSGRRFGLNRSLYVCRGPGDTMVSYFEYARARRDLAWKGTFKEFIRSRELGVEAWCRHRRSWASHCTASLRYEDLKREPVRSLVATFHALGMPPVHEPILHEAVSRSDFAEIRRMEETRGLDERARAQLEPGFRFARRGEVGQWREYFDREDLAYLQEVTGRFGLAGTRLPNADGGERSGVRNPGGR